MPSVIPAGSPVARPANNVLSMARRSLCRRHRRLCDGRMRYLSTGWRSRRAATRSPNLWLSQKIRRNVGALLGFAGVGVSIFGFAAGRPDSISVVARSVRSEASASWAWLDAQLLSCGHGNWCRPARRQDRCLGRRWGHRSRRGGDLALGIEENYQTNKPVIDRLFQPG